MHPAFPSRLGLASLLVLSASCGDGTGPVRTYALHTVNGTPLPVPYIFGSLLLIEGASLRLESGGRVISVVKLVCSSDVPPGDACLAPSDPSRNEGTYSEEDGTVTFGDAVYEASFSEDEVVIWFAAGGTTGSLPAVWVYQR